ncbi:MAG: SDR family oxidoreductase [Bacteroidetes bacterium]|nr:SDR family oxidoreductase [Bacteroidota bacterium]
MDFGIRGKTALVVASSSGIGRSTAELLIKEGCKVALCSSNVENLKEATKEIKRAYGIEPYWSKCDINIPSDIENTIKEVESNLGEIDVLVNNCGGPNPGTFEELDESNWEQGYSQVLMSSVRFSRLVLPGMERKNWGRIINITSISVREPIINLMLSNAFRSGVTGFAKSLSNEVGKFNITVNNVAPGYTLTHRLYELAVERAKSSGDSHEHMLAEMAGNVPLKRLARPDEVASVIAFLASDQAGYITGQTITVDGGLSKSLM